MKLFGDGDENGEQEPLLILVLLVVSGLTAAAGLWTLMVAITRSVSFEVPIMILLGALVWWWMAEVLKALIKKR